MKNKISITLLMVMTWVLMLTNSCKKPESTVKIGQSYQGGIVAYIFQPWDSGYSANAQHGLIAAPSDQGAAIVWYNGSYLSTGATDTAIGAGKYNTAKIIAAQGQGNYAASVCHALTLGGYTDWYLPSRAELNELYLNRTLIGGFDYTANYWSSSEVDIGLAWYQYFSAAGGGQSDKYDPSSVRAVRSF